MSRIQRRTSLILLFLVPILLLAHYWMPEQSLFSMFGLSMDSNWFGWPEWNYVFFYFGLTFTPVIVCAWLLLTLKRSVPALLIYSIVEIIVLEAFYGVRLLMPDENFTSVTAFIVLLSVFAFTTGLLIIRFYRKPSLEERYNQTLEERAWLLQKLKKLEKHDLPDIMVNLVNIKTAASLLSEEEWRQVQVVLLEDQEEGVKVITRAMELIMDPNPPTNEKDR